MEMISADHVLGAKIRNRFTFGDEDITRVP